MVEIKRTFTYRIDEHDLEDVAERAFYEEEEPTEEEILAAVKTDCEDGELEYCGDEWTIDSYAKALFVTTIRRYQKKRTNKDKLNELHDLQYEFQKKIREMTEISNRLNQLRKELDEYEEEDD